MRIEQRLQMENDAIMLPRWLASRAGTNCALFYCALVDKFNQMVNSPKNNVTDKVRRKSCFYYSSKEIQEKTGLTRYQQIPCLQKLIKAGFVIDEGRTYCKKQKIRFAIPYTLFAMQVMLSLPKKFVREVEKNRLFKSLCKDEELRRDFKAYAKEVAKIRKRTDLTLADLFNEQGCYINDEDEVEEYSINDKVEACLTKHYAKVEKLEKLKKDLNERDKKTED